MISYPFSPLDYIDQSSTRRFRYEIDIRMNYLPHEGRKAARWVKVKQHLKNVVSAFAVAKEQELHQIILLVGDNQIPPVFGPIATQFHDAVKRQVALSVIMLGNGEKITLWAYHDDTKFNFVPAFVLRTQRRTSPLNIKFPKIEIPPELKKKLK